MEKLEYLDLEIKRFSNKKTTEQRQIWCTFGKDLFIISEFPHTYHTSDAQLNSIYDLCILLLNNGNLYYNSIDGLCRIIDKNSKQYNMKLDKILENLDYIKENSKIEKYRNLPRSSEIQKLVSQLEIPEIEKISRLLEQNLEKQSIIENYSETLLGYKI